MSIPLPLFGVALLAVGATWLTFAQFQVRDSVAAPASIVSHCGGVALYGGEEHSGFTQCDVEHGVLIGAHDPSRYDGDPEMHLDVQDRTLRIRTEEREFEVRLEPPAESL